MSDTVNIGSNLYEQNKILIEKYEKKLRGKALTNKIEENVIPYFERKNTTNYFMLLCHEKRDYTIFHYLSDNESYRIDKIVEELKECLANRGDIYVIEDTEDEVALEIWIKYSDGGEMVCYYLFPCDDCILEI